MKHTCYQNKISALVSDMLVNLGRQYEISHLDVHPAFSAINKTRSYMLENVDKKLTLKELSNTLCIRKVVFRYCIIAFSKARRLKIY